MTVFNPSPVPTSTHSPTRKLTAPRSQLFILLPGVGGKEWVVLFLTVLPAHHYGALGTTVIGPGITKHPPPFFSESTGLS